MNNITPKCENFLKGYWDKNELEKGLKDPINFLRKVINPYLRNLRKKGKNVPLVHLSGDRNNPILDL